MVYLERAGKPAVGIVSGGFEHDAEASANAFGMPSWRSAVVPHVLTGLPDEEIRSDAEGAFATIVDVLTAPGYESRGNGAALAGVEAPPATTVRFQGWDRLEAVEKMNQTFLDTGWGDGFPLAPPTPERVEGMLRGTTLDPHHVVGVMPPGMGIATVENLAINAVMAGCEPMHLPILIAAVESIVKTRGPGWDMSTTCSAPLMLINGPIVKELGINSGRCTLGPGKQSRANIVLGRALRLIKMNVGKNYPGEMDMDTIGSPAKFSLCAAENEEASPWEPFHVEKGMPAEASTVTVIDITDVKEASNMYSRTPEKVLDTVALQTGAPPKSYSYMTTLISGHVILVMLAPEHADVLRLASWSKSDAKAYLWNRARVPAHWHTTVARDVPDFHIRPSWKWLLDLPDAEREKIFLPTAERPEDYEIVVVGGTVGKTLTFTADRGYEPEEIRHRVPA